MLNLRTICITFEKFVRIIYFDILRDVEQCPSDALVLQKFSMTCFAQSHFYGPKFLDTYNSRITEFLLLLLKPRRENQLKGGQLFNR